MATETLRCTLLGLAIVTFVCTAGCAKGAQGGDDDTGDDDQPDAAADRPDADPDEPDADPDEPDAGTTPPIDAASQTVDASTQTTDAAQPIDPDLIDDLEDGNDKIRQVSGRVGFWYTFHDDTVAGVQTPAGDFAPTMGGAGAGSWSAKTTGSGYIEWGAGMGFDLNTGPSAMVKGKFDAGEFTGVSFRAKGSVPIRFAVESVGVLSTTLGGTCTPSTVEGQECDDVHGKAITPTTSWQVIQVPFSQLAQDGWGKPVTFDKTKLTAVAFQVGPGLTFDVSIDDVRLY